MFAMSELHTYIGDSGPPTPGDDARLAEEVARRYMSSFCSQWQGGVWTRDFEKWLASFWVAELPARPKRLADAVSPHGGGGRGIAWYGTSAGVAGYIPGVAGGYWIPREAID